MTTNMLAYFVLLLPLLHHVSAFSSLLLQRPAILPSPASSHWHRNPSKATRLQMSLKPAAVPLLDSGKALARSGELLIDATTALDIYGGGLSQCGASIRNSGDCVAQAAASCRFKTAAELVTDELREAATCLQEGSSTHLKRAVEEAKTDEDARLIEVIQRMISIMDKAAISLEASGAAILQRKEVTETGQGLFVCGSALEELSNVIRDVATDVEEVSNSGDRMAFAATKMMEAGNNLKGVEKPKPKGKSWLKG